MSAKGNAAPDAIMPSPITFIEASVSPLAKASFSMRMNQAVSAAGRNRRIGRDQPKYSFALAGSGVPTASSAASAACSPASRQRRFREVELELHHSGPGRDVPGADVGVEQLRPLLHHTGGDQTAPRMPEDQQLLLGEASLQLLRQVDAVRNQPLATNPGRPVLPKRPPSAALVPLHQHEVPLIRRVGRDVGRLHVPRPAVHREQHRLAGVVAANRDPLLNPAHGEERGLFDATALRRRDLSADQERDAEDEVKRPHGRHIPLDAHATTRVGGGPGRSDPFERPEV